MAKLILAAAAVLLFVGCEDEETPVPGAFQPAANPAPVKEKFPYDQNKANQWVKQCLGLQSATLSSAGGNSYTGTGKKGDVDYQLNITQTADGATCAFTTSSGATGKLTTGKHDAAKQ